MEKLEVHVDYRGKPRSLYQTVNDAPSMTVQSDKDAADITKILDKYKQVGIIDNLNMAEAMFKDVTEFQDFADVMRHAKLAEAEFMKLPSKVREIFGHDVATWLDTAHDEEKRDALVAAGVIEETPVDGAPVVEAAGETVPAAQPESPGEG